MSESINNGGPAFPSDQETDSQGNVLTYREFGMTLRDYFAAKAMQGMVEAEYGDRLIEDTWAGYAYRIADAMLKARQS